jgi:CheY-like chemotaxis protein
MPDGGKLRIEAKKERDGVTVSISDTGYGMDEESLENCFDPFFTTKEIGKGTGLGLSTSYGIVKDHGGEIHVFSELNKGTTFKLYFPFVDKEKEEEREETLDVVLGHGHKVLIVDDEMDMLKSVEKALERLDYRVASVASGEKAVLKYQSWRPDMVLLDRNMPEMDGITCARKILEDDPEARIILISGYEETGPTGIDDKTKSFIKGYLSKPIDVQSLTSLLARVIND